MAAAVAALAAVAAVPGVASEYTVEGDAIPSSLSETKGDATRGRAIVVSRQLGLCLLCHSGPFPEEKFHGTIGPDLNAVAARLSEGQIRLRMVDPSRVNAATIMPSYYRTEGLTRVAPAFRDKTILSAQQIEDVVAFLLTLR